MLGVMESAAKDTEAKLKEGKAAIEHRLAQTYVSGIVSQFP